MKSNYRHVFHAGGIADVLKHSVAAHVCHHAKLVACHRPIAVFDSHAGAPAYDLFVKESQRTRESAFGLERLFEEQAHRPPLTRRFVDLHDNSVRGRRARAQLAATEARLLVTRRFPRELQFFLAPFLKSVLDLNRQPRRLSGYKHYHPHRSRAGGQTLLRYSPGSPFVLRSALRPIDTLVLNEAAHPTTHPDILTPSHAHSAAPVTFLHLPFLLSGQPQALWRVAGYAEYESCSTRSCNAGVPHSCRELRRFWGCHSGTAAQPPAR